MASAIYMGFTMTGYRSALKPKLLYHQFSLEQGVERDLSVLRVTWESLFFIVPVRRPFESP